LIIKWIFLECAFRDIEAASTKVFVHKANLVYISFHFLFWSGHTYLAIPAANAETDSPTLSNAWTDILNHGFINGARVWFQQVS